MRVCRPTAGARSAGSGRGRSSAVPGSPASRPTSCPSHARACDQQSASTAAGRAARHRACSSSVGGVPSGRHTIEPPPQPGPGHPLESRPCSSGRTPQLLPPDCIVQRQSAPGGQRTAARHLGCRITRRRCRSNAHCNSVSRRRQRQRYRRRSACAGCRRTAQVQRPSGGRPPIAARRTRTAAPRTRSAHGTAAGRHGRCRCRATRAWLLVCARAASIERTVPVKARRRLGRCLHPATGIGSSPRAASTAVLQHPEGEERCDQNTRLRPESQDSCTSTSGRRWRAASASAHGESRYAHPAGVSAASISATFTLSGCVSARPSTRVPRPRASSR